MGEYKNWSEQYWTHDLSPFLFEFPENWVEVIKIEGIRYYGLAYLVGFLVAAILLRIYFVKGKSPLNPDQQANYITRIIIGVLLGGRLGYMLFYSFDSLMENPLNLLKVWEGGMSSHGGFIGVAVVIVYTAKVEKISLWRLADITVTLTPAGIFFGRIANFINGELYGRVSDVPWAVIFPKAPIEYVAEHGIMARLPRHPSQIYAALLEGLLLFLFAQYQFWKSSGKSKDRIAGLLTGEFLVFYSVVRIFDELFREPDSALISGLTKGQFYSIIMAFIGIGIILYVRKKENVSRGTNG